MRIAEVMTANVECISPNASLIEAARKMKKLNIGPLPVCGENDRLLGMVTDRDIVIRAVADSRDLSDTKVQDIMTPGIEYCLDSDSVEEAARHMREKQIRRLVVLNQDHRLVGIVSLGDLAVELLNQGELVGSALEGISQPSEPRR